MNKELFEIVSQWLKNNSNDILTILNDESEEFDYISLNKIEDLICKGDWLTLQNLIEEKDEGDDFQVKMIKFEILEQKFKELLCKGNQIEALKVLRSELTPLNIFLNRIHELAQNILKSKQEHDEIDYKRFALKLFNDLKSISTGIVFETDRLEELVKQAKEYQKINCKFKFDCELEERSLWIDHKCKSQAINFEISTILTVQDSKIEKISTSRNGTKLKLLVFMRAQTSRNRYKVIQVDLEGKEGILSYFDDPLETFEHSIWPQNDLNLLYKDLRSLLEEIGNEGEEDINAIARMPESNLIIYSSLRQETSLFNGSTRLQTWIRLRCSHILTPSNCLDKYFLLVLDDGGILEISTESYKVSRTIPSVDTVHAVTSAFLDGNRLLIGYNNSTIYYYEDWRNYGHPTRLFKGHTCLNQKVNAILPKSNSNLVISGSEDGFLYGWNVESGRLSFKIKVHDGCVFDILEIGQNEFITCGTDGIVKNLKIT